MLTFRVRLLSLQLPGKEDGLGMGLFHPDQLAHSTFLSSSIALFFDLV